MNAFWNISHIDLSEGLPPLNVAERVHGVFVVFWWRGIPLGHHKVEAAQLPMSEARLAGVALRSIAPAVNAYFSARGLDAPLPAPSARSARIPVSETGAPALLKETLARLDDLASNTGPLEEPSNTTICVVIPTRNRPDTLAACLGSLQALRQKPEEIVVVDNAPQSPATRRVVEDFQTVRYVAESRPGSSAARNTGVHHSSGNIVAFLDDDETVHPGWLAWLKRCFHDPVVAVATGLVLPAELQTEAQFLFESRFSFTRGYCARMFDTDLYERTRTRGVPVWQIGGSGNMAIRRNVFQQVGGFDERLGAGRAGGCEDLELFYRVLAQGWNCHYEPCAVT
ncbi:MAG: glycosyltransferase family 2 protein [Candidatus Binatia bacterium]